MGRPVVDQLNVHSEFKGSIINDMLDMVFRLYDVESGGEALSDWVSVCPT